MGEFWILYAVGGLLLLLGVVATLKNTSISTGHAVLLALGAALIALPHLKDFEFGDGKLKFTTRDEARKLAEAVQAVNEQQAALSTQLTTTTARVTEAITAVTTQQRELEAAVKKTQPTFEIPQLQNFEPTYWNDILKGNELIEKRVEQDRSNFDRLQETLVNPSRVDG